MKQRELTKKVKRYYDNHRADRNYLLGRESGIVNHHFGIGDFDRIGFDASQERITQILNILELNQIGMMITFMGDVKSHHIILDAGCGRGGTVFELVERFGATVHGVTISSYQKNFATKLAEEKRLSDRAIFYEMDYFQLAFPSEMFDHVITSESTQYAVNLTDLFRNLARVLKPKARYTIATWCLRSDVSQSRYADKINAHYGTIIHRLAEYLNSLNETGFENVIKADVTEMALPYFLLRQDWSQSSGVERMFIDGFTEREILYYFITATKR